MMNYDDIMHEQPQSMTCPNCGRKMRLNHSLWKDPKYVCDSFRRDNDCGMVLMIKDYKPRADRSVSA
ncbi:MAG: hypothetical protein K0S39_3861 [Paenibacillus sp.]|jgi:predicted RNA-binding Zn-ribbon protein involved in translation (DUF1610 family)|nr:hypothetical protein [Paenibacillus sp.]